MEGFLSKVSTRTHAQKEVQSLLETSFDTKYSNEGDTCKTVAASGWSGPKLRALSGFDFRASEFIKSGLGL